MVGVPHSKGCLLCRHRRIRCDQSRPLCMQCRKYGVECPGYNRLLQFQDEGPRLQKRYQKKRPAVAVNKVKPDPEAGVHNNASNQHPFTNAPFDELVLPTLVHQSFIHQQPQVFKEFVCAAFPTMFYHNEFRFGDGFTFPDWVERYFGFKDYYDAAVSCVTSVYLAHLTKDPRLQHFSRQKYTHALRAIRHVLTTDEASSDALLIAVILLSYYEMNIRTTQDAWIYHSRAVKQLMLNRGVDAHRSGVGRVCHFAYRPFLVAAALYDDEPCFLDENDWQTLANSLRLEDSQKNSEWSVYISVYEMIFMELVKCPGHIQEARQLASVFSPVALLLVKQIQTTCERLRTLSDELRSMLTSSSQRKQGIIFRSFVGPEPNAFPETSPSLLLGAAVNTITILEKLIARLRVSVYITEEIPSLSTGASDSSSPQSVSMPDSNGLFFGFRLTCELGGGAKKDDPRAFTWLDRVAGSMGLLGAELVYEDAEAI